MSTVQKAFVFIVLVLAVLTATVQLVLFAQKEDLSAKLKLEQSTSRDLQKKLTDAERALEQVTAEKTAAVTRLESELKTTQNELDGAIRDRDSALADKANLGSLVSTANAKLETIGQNMDALAARNDALNTAKINLEDTLTKTKADLQDAQEQYTIASRRVKDA